MNDIVKQGEDLLVQKRRISTTMRDIPQENLRFYTDNPRVYSALRSQGDIPTQEEIQDKLQDMEHVRVLIKDIEQHGGLIEPLIVRDGSLDVLEGNSRLAAYRFLASKNPIRWGRVRCRILPKDTPDDLIFGLLGQIHIKGKKDWVPFEQAGFLHRRHKVQKIDLGTLSMQMGLSRSKIQGLLETYQMMLDHDEVAPQKWSYFYEFVKSRTIKKARDNYPGFDDLIVEKIKTGEIQRAQDLRDDLPTICAAPKVLKKFARGSIDFSTAVEDAVQAGGDDRYFKKLQTFRRWLARDEVGRVLYSGESRMVNRVKFEIKKLRHRIDVLQNRHEK